VSLLWMLREQVRVDSTNDGAYMFPFSFVHCNVCTVIRYVEERHARSSRA
jgi:hypothetical protein